MFPKMIKNNTNATQSCAISVPFFTPQFQRLLLRLAAPELLRPAVDLAQRKSALPEHHTGAGGHYPRQRNGWKLRHRQWSEFIS